MTKQEQLIKWLFEEQPTEEELDALEELYIALKKQAEEEAQQK